MRSEHFTLASCCVYLEPQWPLRQANQGHLGLKWGMTKICLYIFLAILASYYKDPFIDQPVDQYWPPLTIVR